MDSFYDVKGNEISSEKILADFIENYTGSLTDFNEGSEIRNILQAFAVYAMGLEERINDSVYIMDILNADGEYLDKIAEQPQIDMERIEGEQSTGYVLFTIKYALYEELLIPEGTVVTSDTGLDFETVTDNKIMPGELSRECMVQAIDVGADGNIPANSILTKIDGYDAVEGFTVSNPTAFWGGVDYEEDDPFRTRILEKLQRQKFGSKPYYQSVLRQVFPDIHDMLLDSTDDDYTLIVIPNTYEGTTRQAELIQEITSYLSDDNNILLRQTFNVIQPTEKIIDLKVTGQSLSSVSDKIKETLTKYIYGGDLSFAPLTFPGLNLEEEAYSHDLSNAIYQAIPSLREQYDLTVYIDNTYDGGSFSNGENKYKINSITVT